MCVSVCERELGKEKQRTPTGTHHRSLNSIYISYDITAPLTEVNFCDMWFHFTCGGYHVMWYQEKKFRDLSVRMKGKHHQIDRSACAAASPTVNYRQPT